MPIELVWKPSVLASHFHLAQQLLAGVAPVEAALAATLAEPAAALRRGMAASGIDAALWFEHLAPLAGGNNNLREVARLATLKTVGQSATGAALDVLYEPLRMFDAACRQALPRLGDELPLRVGPLRQLWEARGPGLLNLVGRGTDEELIVDRAEVLVVHPWAGGGGYAHKRYNTIRFEAVLTNPLPELPEVVRLAWLLSTLNLDLPRYSETISRPRLALVAPLAMLPPVIEAASSVELVGSGDSVLRQALSAWQVVDSSQLATTGDALLDWWHTWTATRPAWPIALAALDQMLPA